MKVSRLDPQYINDNKGGVPIYITDIVEVKDLEDLGLIACHNHITMGVFNPLYRCNDNWQCSYVLGVDFDNGLHTADEVHKWLVNEKLNHVIVSSKNHLRDKEDGKGIIERFHVFLPFSERIKLPELYPFIAVTLVTLAKWSVDIGATKNRSVYYYKSREVLHVYEDGNPLPVPLFEKLKARQDLLLDKKRELDRKDAERRKKLYGESNPVEMFKRTKYFKMMEQGVLQSDGHRYATSSEIIGGMIKCGLELEEALMLFDEYSNYGKGFTQSSVESRFRQWR